MERIFDGMEHPGAPIQGNFDELVDKNRAMAAEHLKNVSTGITGYQQGFVTFVRRGNLCIANVLLSLREMKVGWHIITCPDGYKPSVGSNNAHALLGTGLEIYIDKGDFVSNVNVGDCWWVGQVLYFTDDPMPA